ncbi:MAG: GHKL domain-containing protein [Spirochaetales bacterium]|nr:GHKL domain-containing protein [Spirochaetales bacterium]
MFASPERTKDRELEEEIKAISRAPLMQVFLKSINCLFAVLDSNRQIITLNDHYLSYLNRIPAGSILGLRVGESLRCIHASEMEGGCGTSRHCRSCGAALAITTAITSSEPVERECALELEENGERKDLFFHVKCEPFYLEERKFYLLFLTDITKDQQRKMLEKIFFHDFNNILGGLSTSAYMLSRGIRTDQVVESIYSTTNTLVKEVEIQRCLMGNDLDYYKKNLYPLILEKTFSKLDDIFREKAESEGKTILFRADPAAEEINSDEALLIRIISNMINNALEATGEGDTITLDAHRDEDMVKITVRNPGFIPGDVQLRIFQRNFSTKSRTGRGLGTYSMKLFGEKVLGGRIGFISTERDGTEFYLILPT